MDGYRWVVEKANVGCEVSGDVSVIHPSLVRARNGDLLLFGNTYPGNRFRAKEYETIVARSTDGGESWSEPRKAFREVPKTDRKLVCATGGVTMTSGRIVLIGSFGSTESAPNETTEVQTDEMSPYGFPVIEVRCRWRTTGECRVLLSDDDGTTWITSEPIDTLGYAPGGAVMQLNDGRLLLPVYGYRHGAPDGEHYSNGFVTSENGGLRWSSPTIVAAWDPELHDLPNEMAILELSDGRWVAFYRDQFTRADHNSTGIFLYRSYSHDRGRTWSVGQQIFPNMGYTSATVLSDGAVLVVGHSARGNVYAVSNDGGETWDYQNLLWGHDGRAGGDSGGFSFVRLDDGRMLIAYYAKADRSQRLKSAYEYGKMRLEVAWLKKVRADSREGRMR